MIIAIASGKGGTGKTTVATSLALSLPDVQYLDCDVEAPNSHIFLSPEFTGEKDAVLYVPEVDESLCDSCGICQQICEFNALAVIPGMNGNSGKVLRFDSLCHGCGACTTLCPRRAIREVPRTIGVIQFGQAMNQAGESIEVITGSLNAGESLAPPVIREIKSYTNPDKTVIIDAPPGTSCPVVTSIAGADYCILVTEPTLFGLHDLTLTVSLTRQLGIPVGVIINRSGIGDFATEEFCYKNDIPVLLKIPFRKDIAEAYARGIPLVRRHPKYRTFFNTLLAPVSMEAD